MNKSTHRNFDLVLASGSQTRASLLKNARVPFEITVPRIDEDSVKQSLLVESIPPRGIADALAELKAKKVAARLPDRFVLGCDQVLAFENQLVSKPSNPTAAIQQLSRMQGKSHQLLSAAVIYKDAQPVWRHVGVVRMTMRSLSDSYLDAYVTRNWGSIRDCVGAYKLEEEGVRLFSSVQGDYFHVLGMPLLEVLSFLSQHGVIRS